MVQHRTGQFEPYAVCARDICAAQAHELRVIGNELYPLYLSHDFDGPALQLTLFIAPSARYPNCH